MPEVSDEAISVMAKHAAERPSSLTSIDIWALGGAMSRISPDATAFAWHNAPFLFGIESNWDDPKESEKNITWTRNVFQDMKRFTKGGTYLNFPGFAEEGEDLIKGAYGIHYARLKSIKAKYDPQSIFHGNFNIKP